ncbi:MAG TPA: T9SS type A sorting domain-containing protein [Bacteroidia bacterium]|nr:T9SS type A sorting domain-containing protein [Bacteroidia bacterium]
MKKQITLLVFAFILFSHVHAQSFQWAAQMGGTDYDTGEDIAFDSSGNVYLVGIFNSSADFDPGAGTYNLTSAGAQDVYIVRLDSNKNFTWAVRVGGSHQDFAYSIAVTGSSVYICGNFRDTADFDPGPGVSNLISAGGSDIFILKLDTASNFTWVKQIGGTGNDVAEKLALDNAQNILVCGVFQDTVDFDPGIGLENMISNGSADAYVLKTDANGNYIWAGHYGNNSGQLAFGIATDASNDVYVTGQFYGTTDFDPGAGVYNLMTTGFNSNIYVLKWSAAGNFTWADNMGNSSGGDWGASIKTDAAGNPVITGTYFGTVDFDPGAGTFNLTAAGSNGDIFVVKLTSSTGAFMFAKSMGGTGLNQPYGLALNSAGSIYVTGLFSLTADFDPDGPAFNLTASGPSDAFIVELDASGNFLWAYGFGGTDSDFGRGISTYGSDVYATGVFAFMPDFDPGLPVYNLSSFSNSSDAFLLKLRFCTPVQTAVNYGLCPGDSVFAGGAYQYDPGVYYDYYTAAGGCDSIVATTVQYTFTLDLGNDFTGCNGQSVLLDANVPGAVYLWSTGATTQTIVVVFTGIYWVSVTYNGCAQQDTIHVTFLPLPVVNLGMDTVICTTSSVILDAGPGFTSYLWSDGSTLQTLTFYGSIGTGIYNVEVMVTDSFGCFNSDAMIVTVTVCTGINDASSALTMTFSAYPNPAGDFMVIESAEKIKQMTLFDTAGKMLMQQNYNAGRNSVRLSFHSLADGMYYLQMKHDGMLYTTKVVIQH